MTSALPQQPDLTAGLATPQVLKAALAAVWVAAVIFWLAVVLGARGHRGAVKVIGKDSAPSVIAAQKIKAALADIDASAANELLLKPGQGRDSVQAFNQRRMELSQFIVAASENITYGEAERRPLEQIEYWLGRYIEKIQQARDARVNGDASAIAPYREAAGIVNDTLLPNAAKLDEANRSVLDSTYVYQKEAATATLAGLLISGGLLVGILIWLQLYLVTHMRRLLNPPLAAATLLCIIFLMYSANAFLGASEQLKIAREDSFQSIHTLWQARAVAYGANADESRFLLDPTHGPEYERAFQTKISRIADLPPDIIKRTAKEAQVSGGARKFMGLLADELNNTTFPGEREAALRALDRFGDYIAIDQTIRSLQASGKTQQALALCIGTAPGQSNWAFAQFDEALGQTIEINQKEFDRAIAQAFSLVKGFEISAPFIALLIAILAYLGLRPRLKEYE